MEYYENMNEDFQITERLKEIPGYAHVATIPDKKVEAFLALRQIQKWIDRRLIDGTSEYLKHVNGNETLRTVLVRNYRKNQEFYPLPEAADLALKQVLKIEAAAYEVRNFQLDKENRIAAFNIIKFENGEEVKITSGKYDLSKNSIHCFSFRGHPALSLLLTNLHQIIKLHLILENGNLSSIPQSIKTLINDYE